MKFLPKNVYFNILYLISFQVMTKTLTKTFKVARVSTQKLWKIESAINFLMLIKVYIFGMEMSQKIYYWYQILLKIHILTKWQKLTFLVKKILDSLKTQPWVQNAEIAWKSY